jgi:hypothetical protein
MADVVRVVVAMGLRAEPGPLGVTVRCLPLGERSPMSATRETLRIERGSGVGSRGDLWTPADVRSGASLAAPLRTERALRRFLTEWLAGPRPSGGAYARLNHNRFGESYVWVRRHNRSARCQN